MKEPANYKDILKELNIELEKIEIEAKLINQMYSKLQKYKLWLENVIQEKGD